MDRFGISSLDTNRVNFTKMNQTTLITLSTISNYSAKLKWSVKQFSALGTIKAEISIYM